MSISAAPTCARSRSRSGRRRSKRSPTAGAASTTFATEAAAASASCALARVVGPLELHRVGAKRPGLPGADVADLAVLIVIPTLAGDGIGDRLAQLVRAGRGERIQYGQRSDASTAIGVRHHRIEDVAQTV